jgi:hypothetical protein
MQNQSQANTQASQSSDGTGPTVQAPVLLSWEEIYHLETEDDSTLLKLVLKVGRAFQPDKMAARNDRLTLLKLAFRVGRAFQPDKMAARNDRLTLLKLAFRVGRASCPVG